MNNLSPYPTGFSPYPTGFSPYPTNLSPYPTNSSPAISSIFSPSPNATNSENLEDARKRRREEKEPIDDDNSYDNDNSYTEKRQRVDSTTHISNEILASIKKEVKEELRAEFQAQLSATFGTCIANAESLNKSMIEIITSLFNLIKENIEKTNPRVAQIQTSARCQELIQLQALVQQLSPGVQSTTSQNSTPSRRQSTTSQNSISSLGSATSAFRSPPPRSSNTTTQRTSSVSSSSHFNSNPQSTSSTITSLGIPQETLLTLPVETLELMRQNLIRQRLQLELEQTK